MRFPNTQRVDRAGVSMINHIVTDSLGWIFREQETTDVGIDAHLEIADPADDANEATATGQLIAVQIKSGLSFFERQAPGGWWLRCDSAHTSYWLGHSLPVVVMLYNPTTKLVYWQQVSEATLTKTGSSWKILIPESHTLGPSSADRLRPLARRKSDLGAFAHVLEEVSLSNSSAHPNWVRLETYRTLLQARLMTMFPGLSISSTDVDVIGIEMVARLDRKHLRIFIIGPGSNFDRVAASCARWQHSIMPTVVVIPDADSRPPQSLAAGSIFEANWDSTSGDSPLREAVDGALRWIDAQFPLENSS